MYRERIEKRKIAIIKIIQTRKERGRRGRGEGMGDGYCNDITHKEKKGGVYAVQKKLHVPGNERIVFYRLILFTSQIVLNKIIFLSFWFRVTVHRIPLYRRFNVYW